MRLHPRFNHFIAIYRCDVVTSPLFSTVCANVKVELFREERMYHPLEYRNMVIAAVKDAVYCSPEHPPIRLDDRNQHLALLTRTRKERSAQEKEACEFAVDRVVSVLASLVSPELFRIQLFRGWLKGGPRQRELGALVKGVTPIQLMGSQVALQYAAASSGVARTPGLSARFDLMSRFIARGLSESSPEEAFIWLWTALEIFPMVNTTDIKPISNFLAPYLGRSPSVVKDKLKIGFLFGIRSKIVHDGHFPLPPKEGYSALAALERLVAAVVRHGAGIPYDGTFARLFDSQSSSRSI